MAIITRGRTDLVGLDRPPGAPPRGARQGLFKIRYGLRHLMPPAEVGIVSKSSLDERARSRRQDRQPRGVGAEQSDAP